MASYPVNGTSTIKRARRTRSEIEALDAALCEIVDQFSPVTVRQVFYQAVNRGLGLHVTRGFASITYLQEAAEQIEADGRPTYVYVLTDFDPSGVSIAEKVEEELKARAPYSEIIVERLAVDREQIDRWSLPTRPTKASDARAAKFRRVHGTDSVELDAIPPDELRKLVRDAIDSHMEPWRLRQFRMVEREERDTLRSMFGGAA